MPKQVIPDFSGGINTGEQATIKDNELVTANNFIYDANGRIRTRKGHSLFGNSVGDSPITSTFFHRRDDTGEKILLAVSGTSMYKYTESTGNWTSIKSGLTEFEPSNGDKRTRWDFIVYKNVIYCCNGVDDYMSVTIPDGTVTTYPDQPKVRYIEYMNDTIFAAGEDANPITLYYTTSQPTDGAAIDTNALVVGGDEMGKINGLREIGQVVLVGKENKIYSVNVAAKSSQPLDSMDGWFANRSIQNVGNSLVYATRQGIDSLKARSGVDGSGALASDLLSANIDNIVGDIPFKSLNASCSYYNKESKIYYFSFDSNGDDIPDTTICYSAVTKGWTTASLPSAYDYGVYVDDDNEWHYLACSSTTGQMYEIESGYTDNGAYIDYILETKNYDLGSPEMWKDCDYIDIVGAASGGADIKVEILGDGEVVQDENITGCNVSTEDSIYPLGTEAVGTKQIGGGGAEEINLFTYTKRIPLIGAGGWRNIQVRMYSNIPNIQWTLDKLTIDYLGNTEDLIPLCNY